MPWRGWCAEDRRATALGSFFLRRRGGGGERVGGVGVGWGRRADAARRGGPWALDRPHRTLAPEVKRVKVPDGEAHVLDVAARRRARLDALDVDVKVGEVGVLLGVNSGVRSKKGGWRAGMRVDALDVDVEIGEVGVLLKGGSK